MSKKKQSRKRLDPNTFNAVYPVTSVRFYKNGSAEIVRECKLQSRPPSPKRGKIKLFSSASRARLALVAKETSVRFESMITLTYGVNFPGDGMTVKAHLREFLRRMKVWYGKFDYLWFLEFQKRGAPHVHVLTNLPAPDCDKQRAFLASIWVDGCIGEEEWEYCTLNTRDKMVSRKVMLWFHRRPECWEAIRHPDGAARYVVKYATKMEQKEVPNQFTDIGRFWGHSARVGRLTSKKVEMSEDVVRGIIERTRPNIADWDVLPRLIFDAIKGGLGKSAPPENVSRETIGE